MPAKVLASWDTSTGILFTDRRQYYLDKEVSELWTSVAPFLTFSSKMRSKTTKDPDYKMFQHKSGWTNMRFQRNTTASVDWGSAGAGPVNDDIVMEAVDKIIGLPAVDDSWVGLAGKCYLDDGSDTGKLGEYIFHFVITAEDGTQVTIKNLGCATHATFLAVKPTENSHFIVTHSLSADGTVAPKAASDELELVYNSCSIIETAIQVDGTLYEAALRGYSSELARLRNDRTMLHKMKINNMYYNGMRSSGIGGTAYGASDTDDSTFAVTSIDSSATGTTSKIIRSGMGVITALNRYGRSDITHGEQNIFTVNQATYKYDHFVDDTAKVFQYVPTAGLLYGFCDMRFKGFFSKVAQAGFLGNSGAKLQISDFKLDKIGLNVQDLITPSGVIRLVYDPALKNEAAGTMVLVDPAHIGQVVYRKTRIKFNVLIDDDFDGVKDNIRSDEGPWLDLIQKHSLWTLT